MTSLFDVPRTCDAAVVPMGKTGPYNDWTGVVVSAPDLGLAETAHTRFQSTAELTNAYVAELNYSNFVLTVTNPTDGYDSGTVALVLASHMGTIHFVDYELGPKESKSYNLTVAGHIGVGADEKMVVLGKGWDAYLNANIITFESDADRDAYRNAVVYEENMGYYVEQGTGKNVHVVVCSGQPGDDWLKQYTSITRHDKPVQDPALSHDICKQKSGNGK